MVDLSNYQGKLHGDFLIRKAAVADFEEFNEVHKQGWVMAHVDPSLGITEADILYNFADEQEVRERFLSKFVNSHLVLVHNNKIVGFFGVYEKEQGIYSGGVYLLQEYTGQGLGKVLLTEILNLVPTGSIFQVEVAKHNQRSLKFFLKNGFKPTGIEAIHTIKIGKSFPTILLARQVDRL